MSNRSPVTNEQIAASYAKHGNIWKVADELGIVGQTVSRRMKEAGIRVNKRFLTDAEIELVRDYYTSTPAEIFSVNDLAARMGRRPFIVSRIAASMGLAKLGRAKSIRTIESLSKPRKPGYVHPKGFAGKTHTPEVLEKVGIAAKRYWATAKAFGIGGYSPENREATSKRMSVLAANRTASQNFTRTKGGRRDDLGDIFFRSSWEANYARYLNLMMKMKIVESWEFEPRTFWFDGVRRGTASYLPDFRVKYRHDPVPEFVEIKGWIVPKDRTKWRRMAKYYPDTKLVIIAEKEYRELQNRWASAIPEWEKGKASSPAFTRLFGQRAYI